MVHKKEKQSVFEKTLPIKADLVKILHELEVIPRTTVAARQLSVIISHLEIWQKRYMPEPEEVIYQGHQAYSRVKVDSVLAKYREQGYFALDQEEKKVIEWFDEKYGVSKSH